MGTETGQYPIQLFQHVSYKVVKYVNQCSACQLAGVKKQSESSPPVAESPQAEDPAIIVRGKLSPPPSKYSLRSFPLSVSLKNGAQVFINYCWTPRTLAVGASDDFSSVTELAEVIKKYVATGKMNELLAK